MFDTELLKTTLQEVADIKDIPCGLISSVVIDSRKAVKGSLFFAFRGENDDGHRYIGELLEKGVYCVGDEGDHDSEMFIKVPDVLEFLSLLAKKRRSLYRGKVIALTGSNGKTTTREFLTTFLSLSGKTVYRSWSNLNNHIGLPLVILNLPMNIDYMVLEMGMNHKGEIKKLSEIAHPDYSVITNIGSAHIGNFKSQQDLADAKLELFEGTGGVIVADISNRYVKEWIDKNKERSNKIAVYQQDSFKSRYNEFKEYPEYLVDNLLTAAEVVKVVEGKAEKLNEVLKKSKIPEMRGETKQVGERKFIVDCYNANPDSMLRSIAGFYKKAIEEGDENICMVLGSMFELGELSKKMHQELVNYLKTLKLLKRAFLIGSEFEKIKHCFLNEKRVVFLGNIKDVVPLLPETGLFLLKGSRSNRLEEIFELLE